MFRFMFTYIKLSIKVKKVKKLKNFSCPQTYTMLRQLNCSDLFPESALSRKCQPWVTKIIFPKSWKNCVTLGKTFVT